MKRLNSKDPYHLKGKISDPPKIHLYFEHNFDIFKN